MFKLATKFINLMPWMFFLTQGQVHFLFMNLMLKDWLNIFVIMLIVIWKILYLDNLNAFNIPGWLLSNLVQLKLKIVYQFWIFNSVHMFIKLDLSNTLKFGKFQSNKRFAHLIFMQLKIKDGFLEVHF